MEKVRIGQITAPVGIKGEVRVFPYTDRESRFSDIEKVFVGEGRQPQKEILLVLEFLEKFLRVWLFYEIDFKKASV